MKLDAWALTVPVSFAIARTRIRYSHHLLLRVRRDGQDGWGGSVLYARRPHELAPHLDRAGRLLVDAPAGELRAALAAVEATDVRHAVDGALWDLEARASGRRVADLLGARPAAEVAVTEQLFVVDPARAAATAAAMAARGTRAIKLKVSGDPDADVRLAAAVREAAGDSVQVRLDANRGYTLAQAAAVAPRFAELGIRQWEEPAAGSFAEIAQLRAETALGVILDESVRTPRELDAALTAGALDWLNVKLPRVGGLTAAQRARDAVRSAGGDVSIGCAEDLGPSMWAIVHAAAAWHAAEAEGIGWERLGLEIEGPVVRALDGSMALPGGTGWGGPFRPELHDGHGGPVRRGLVPRARWGRRFRAVSVARHQRQRATNAALRVRGRLRP